MNFYTPSLDRKSYFHNKLKSIAASSFKNIAKKLRIVKIFLKNNSNMVSWGKKNLCMLMNITMVGYIFTKYK